MNECLYLEHECSQNEAAYASCSRFNVLYMVGCKMYVENSAYRMHIAYASSAHTLQVCVESDKKIQYDSSVVINVFIHHNISLT